MNRAAVFASLVVIMASAANATAQTTSPYAGQQQRTIKALSDQEIGDLLEGRGMGLAKALRWVEASGGLRAPIAPQVWVPYTVTGSGVQVLVVRSQQTPMALMICKNRTMV